MLNTLRIFEDLSHHMDRQAAKKIAGVLGQVYEEILQTDTKKEFAELAQSLSALGEAQKKTENSLTPLITEHGETTERLENMSDAVGYTLENHSYRGLPPLLKRDLGIEVEGRLLRRYLPGDKKGRYLQVNIYGWGRKNKHKVLILGEAKTSISRREVGRFQKLTARVAWLQHVSPDNVCEVIVVHDITPAVEEYARQRGIHIYWSYDL